MPYPAFLPQALNGPLALRMTTLLLVGCGDQQPATQEFYVEPSVPDNPTAQTDAAAAGVADRESLPPATPIVSIDASGASGELRIDSSVGKVLLVIEVEGLPVAEEFPAHVHRGVCAEGGPVAAALNSLVTGGAGTGGSTTTLPAESLPITEPLFVQIHGPSGAPIACGDIAEL